MNKNLTMFCLVGMTALMLTACGEQKKADDSVMTFEKESERVVTLFSPMEKSMPDVDNVARRASERTVIMAEEKLGVTVDYITYTAEDYQDKTYDEITLERARNDMDDLYLLNPDTVQILAEEGKLMDLSMLDSAKNLRDVVKTANVVNGKLVAIPQEVVAYGLFINKDLFDKYQLELPETPEDFLECCRVFKENGIETPVGANRWWLENFVFAQAYADLYNGNTTQQEIQQLNSGERKYSDYMKNGFEFLKKKTDGSVADTDPIPGYERVYEIESGASYLITEYYT